MKEERDNTFILDVARQLWNNRAVVFVGAGFSANADPSFPVWTQLADKMWERVRTVSPDQGKAYADVLCLAEEFQSAFDRPQLDSLLLTSCHRPACSNLGLHKQLLSLPWVDVLTTNYDTLLEQAANLVLNIRYSVVLNRADLSIAKSPRIIKLHGSFPSERPFVITARDYRQYPYTHAPFVNTARQQLIENTLVLIGFSGDDPNFLNWLEWVRVEQGANVKKIYLIGVAPISRARQKMLHDRGIDYHNIVEYYETGSDRVSAFRSFFKDLNRQNIRADEWPDLPSDFIKYRNAITCEAEVKSFVEEVRKIRKAYPGWVVPPYAAMWNLNFTFNLSHPMLPDEKLPLTIELRVEFYWQLFWLCTISLSTPTLELCNQAEKFLWRADLKESGERRKGVDIAMALLRAYREHGCPNDWSRVRRRIKEDDRDISVEQIAAVRYEDCLFDLTTFDYVSLKKHFEELERINLTPIWTSRKARILIEMGQVDSAERLLKTAIVDLRAKNPMGEDSIDYESLSVESVILVLLQRIKQTKGTERERVDSQSKSEPRHPDLDTRQYYDRQYELRKFKCDIGDVVNGLASSVGFGIASCAGKRPVVKFDLQEGSPASYYMDPSMYEWAFEAYLRINDRIGHPWRIKNWIFGYSHEFEYFFRQSALPKGEALLFVAGLAGQALTQLVVTRKFLMDLDAGLRKRCLKNLIWYVENQLQNSVCNFKEGCIDLLSRFVVVADLQDKQRFAGVLRLLYAKADRIPYADYSSLIQRYVQTLKKNDFELVLDSLAALTPNPAVGCRILAQLPHVLALVADRGFKCAKNAHRLACQSAWFSCLFANRAGDCNVRNWSIVNLLSAGCLGMLTDESIEKGAQILRNEFPERWRLLGVKDASSFIFRWPWSSVLDIRQSAIELAESLARGRVPEITNEAIAKIDEFCWQLEYLTGAVSNEIFRLESNMIQDVVAIVIGVAKRIYPIIKERRNCPFHLLPKWERLGSLLAYLIVRLSIASGASLRSLKEDRVLLKAISAYSLTLDVALEQEASNKSKSFNLRTLIGKLGKASAEKTYDATLAIVTLCARQPELAKELFGEFGRRLNREVSPLLANRFVVVLARVLGFEKSRCADLSHGEARELLSRLDALSRPRLDDDEETFQHRLMLCRNVSDLAETPVFRDVMSLRLDALSVEKHSAREVFSDLG